MIIEASSGGERRSGSERRRFPYDRRLPERHVRHELGAPQESDRRNGGVAEDTEKRIERRKSPRLRVCEGAFVAVRPHYHGVGQIIDINMEGLSFAYVAQSRKDADSTELDIFLLNGDFYLERIPFETIADFGLPPHSPFGSVVTKRRSVRFGRLSSSQESRLKYFIDHYTLPTE